MPNLLIENIDEALLEKQRLALKQVISFVQDRASTAEDLEATVVVDGLLNMLDHWSKKTFVDVRVCVKEWFDKANGNSYFSARVWVEGDLKIMLPIQYGYEEHGVYEAIKALSNFTDYPSMTNGQAPWRYCEENKMRLEYYKEENCLQRDVKSWGKNV